jgi:hypothetical protein
MSYSTGIYSTEAPFYFGTVTSKVFDRVIESIKDLTVEMIKTNELTGRHGLMLSLARAGHCPLAEEYFHARQVHFDRHKSTRDEHKGLSSYNLLNSEFLREADEYTFKKTGWLFKTNP